MTQTNIIVPKKTIVMPFQGTMMVPFADMARDELVAKADGFMARVAIKNAFDNGGKNDYAQKVTDFLGAHFFAMRPLVDDAVAQNRISVRDLSAEYNFVTHIDIPNNYLDAARAAVHGFENLELKGRKRGESIAPMLKGLAGKIPQDVIVIDSDMRNLNIASRLHMRPVYVGTDSGVRSFARSLGYGAYRNLTDFARDYMIRFSR